MNRTEKQRQPDRRGGRKSRRSEIVTTAAGLLRKRGLPHVTTKVIAESVPCSEGAIYVHFKDRLDLILTVLEDSLPEMLVPLHSLKDKIGSDSVEKNLVNAVEGLVRFQTKTIVMLCSLVDEPELKERFRQSLGSQKRGPERGISTLAEYIAMEQRSGRLASKINAKEAARTLMAGAFFYVFCEELFGTGSKLDATRMVRCAIRD